ncbi:MAG TPA: hypothetical protein VMC84_08420 [Methanocella sp.]|uniref:hypothetical protein n=1 Tax=Methanocella sp. TaxID=2052833 RepID=UPI002B8BE269|nr:hypothetical protein [Methanocella sp.]HTY91184.1 hypothetical protein [Methanocella sp.]
MEAVYFYDDKEKKPVDKLLEEEFFKRLGPSVREAAIMGTSRKTGYYLYVRADNPEKMKEAVRLIDESKIPIAKITGDEEKHILDYVHKEEDEAAAGMGAIFG